jgi:hypothetical protein
MMKRIGVLTLAIVMTLIATPMAQTVQNVNLVWEYLGPTGGLKEVQSYTHVVALDGTTIATPATCIVKPGTTADVQCSVSQTGVNMAVAHTFSVAVSFAGITKTMIVNGINFANGPKDPTNPRATVTITITVS